jgi:hypothetical protein
VHPWQRVQMVSSGGIHDEQTPMTFVVIWCYKGVLRTCRAPEDLRELGTDTVPRLCVVVQLQLKLTRDPVAGEVILATNLWVRSEDNVPDDDIEERPLHLRFISENAIPVHQGEGKVHGFPVVRAVEVNAVCSLRGGTSLWPARLT